MNWKHHVQSHRTVSVIMVVAFLAAVTSFLSQVWPINPLHMRRYPGTYLIHGSDFLFQLGVLLFLYRMRNHKSKGDQP
jgi:hypothetical protein